MVPLRACFGATPSLLLQKKSWSAHMPAQQPVRLCTLQLMPVQCPASHEYSTAPQQLQGTAQRNHSPSVREPQIAPGSTAQCRRSTNCPSIGGSTAAHSAISQPQCTHKYYRSIKEYWKTSANWKHQSHLSRQQHTLQGPEEQILWETFCSCMYMSIHY